MNDISDEIIKEAADGNIESFQAIYKAFAGYVYRVALNMVDHPSDAEEIVQDVFVRVFHQLKHFRFEAAIKTWIYRVTVNVSLNFRKKRSRYMSGINEYRESIRSAPQAVLNDDGCAQDYQEEIHRLLKALNPQQRMCVILRGIEGLSYQEIARTLNVNINTVRTRLKRAREKLLKIKDEVISHGIK